MKTKIILFLLSVLFISTLQAQTPVTGGDISGTWSAVNSPYLIQGNCTIVNLTIEPGVEIRFQGDHKFEVEGSLHAQGFYSDSIIFKADTGNQAGWIGIKFKNPATSSALSYVRIEGSSDKGAIQIDQRPPAIFSHCRIVNNRADGIYVKDATLEMQNCIIQNNTGNGIVLDGGQLSATNIIIAGNTLAGLTATHNDDSALLVNCVIADNGTDGITATNGLLTVQNSIIYDNQTPVTGTIQATYSCIQGPSPYPGTGNKNYDPQFSDNVSYELATQSACIDSGTTQILQSDRYFPPSRGGIRNDMGAYGGPGAGGWYPPLYIVPETYNFGQVTVDSSRFVTLTVKNYRDFAIPAVLNLFVPSAPAVFSTDFSPVTIPVLGNETLELTFTPRSVQIYAADMVLLTSAHGTVSVPVEGEGVVADIEIFSNLYDFGAIAIGDSATFPIPVRNTGNDTLRLNVQPPTQSVFYLNPYQSVIPPSGGMSTLPVTFKPLQIADYWDSLVVNSNDPDENPVVINLLGTGSGARIAVEPDSIDFDSVAIGSLVIRTVSVLNTGSSDLVISEIQSSNSLFDVLDSGLLYPLTIEPDGVLDLDIRFAPVALGAVYGQVTIRSNSIGSRLATLDLSGIGTGALLELSATGVDFGTVALFSDSTLQVTMNSAGNLPLVINDITIENITSDSVFSLVNRSIQTPLTLLPGEDTILTIRYEAKNIGIDSGRVDISWGDSSTLSSVHLHGKGIAPVVSISADSLNFGGVYIPFDSIRVLSISNYGNTELVIDSLYFPDQSPESVVYSVVLSDNELPLTIPPGDSVEVKLRFAPLRDGFVSTILRIHTNDPVRPQVDVFLSGTGLMPDLLLSRGDIDFGSVILYTTEEETITLTNRGNTSISIQSIFIGQDTSDFLILDSALTFPLVLNPEDAAEINLQFTPTLRGDRFDRLYINSNSPGLEQLSVDLNGLGLGAKIDYIPSFINFSTVILGRESWRDLDISNSGNDTLILNQIEFTGLPVDSMMFSTPDWQEPLSILPDSTATFTLVFHPLREGPVAANIELYSNDPDSSVVSIELEGNGVSAAPVISLSHREIEFGDIQIMDSRPADLMIRNRGNEDLTILELNVEHANPDTVFRITNLPFLPLHIANDDSVEFEIRFDPVVERFESAMLFLVSDDPATPQDSVLLQGTGIAPFPIIEVNPSMVNFGRVLLSEDSLVTINIRNRGFSDLVIYADSLGFSTPNENNFSIGNQADLTVNPGDSDFVYIYFQPQTRGVFASKLRIVSNDPNQHVWEIDLVGEGYADETARITFDPLLSSNSFVKGQPATISFIISDVALVDSAFIYNRNGGSEHYTKLPLVAHVNGQNWYRQISGDQISERGLEYYVCVFHNQEYTLFPAAGEEQPQTIQVIVLEQLYPQLTQTAKYQLISIPLVTGSTNLSSNNVFGDDLGPYNDTAYRMFELTNGSSYNELNTMSQPLPPGKAVWLITKNPTELDINNAQSVSTATNYSLSLTAGWNLVGSPFAFNVDWGLVSDEFVLRNYTGSGWGFTSLLPAYGGCAVYVPGDTILTIPARETETGVMKQISTDSWHMQISVFSGELEDRYNYAGVKNSATNHIDRFDYPEPPVIGDYVALAFTQEAESITYSTDYREAGKEGYSWDISLQSSASGEKRIDIEPFDLPEDFEWALISPESNTCFRENPIKIDIQTAGFRLVVGSPEYVAGNISGLSSLPKSFALHQNYPNPFNPHTIVRYQLPVATKVYLSIYNILGQKIYSLTEGQYQQPGTYYYEWNGINSTGQTVSSGIYILHIKTYEFQKSIKMVLQR